jgi:hypothetical protein
VEVVEAVEAVVETPAEEVSAEETSADKKAE